MENQSNHLLGLIWLKGKFILKLEYCRTRKTLTNIGDAILNLLKNMPQNIGVIFKNPRALQERIINQYYMAINYILTLRIASSRL